MISQTHHKIYFTAPLTQQNCFELSQMRDTLDGVLGVQNGLNNKSAVIHYDAFIVSFSSILKYLITRQFSIKSGIIASLKFTWFDYLDTTAKDNAHAPAPACCNKAPKIVKSK